MRILVLEKIDSPFPEWRLLREAVDTKTRFAFAEDIHPAFGEAFDLHDSCSHAYTMNGVVFFFFFAFAQQEQAEDVAAVEAAIDHEFVAFFEDVQRNDYVWK